MKLKKNYTQRFQADKMKRMKENKSKVPLPSPTFNFILQMKPEAVH